MDKKIKCIEYYFDSNKYNESEVLENMEKEKLEFPKKKSKITITLNKYGIYIARLEFINNEIALIKQNRRKKQKIKKLYGQYKTTRTYTQI